MTADALLDALSAVRRALRRTSRRPGELAAMTGSQLELVRLLRRRPGVTVAAAARELRVAGNTVSTLVTKLSATGIVVKQPDAADRRVAHLDLSPRARRTVEEWRDRRVDRLERALARLSPRERATLDDAGAVLERLARLVEEDDTE